MWDWIYEILQQKGDTQLIASFVLNTLSILIEFLEPFKEASDALEQSSQATFHFVPI